VVTSLPPSLHPEVGADQSVVFIVDDDESFREALRRLLRSVGLQAEIFGSALDLLQSKLPDIASCLVLDVRLPGLSGLDFQAELAKQNINIPIIFITGHGDIPMPLREQDLLDAVRVALERDRKRREDNKATSDVQARYETLSPREREIMNLVTAGLMNKQVAAKTELAEITVKIHRGHIMKKMAAKSFADLVKMAEMLGLHHGPR
jgi:FixJ family two-component response regulator